MIVSAMETTAKYFLGEHPDHRPVVGWNQPGGIDTHIATELNLGEPDPTQRVMYALGSLLTEICALVKQEENGTPEENTRWQMDAAIQQTSRLMLGLPLERPGPENE